MRISILKGGVSGHNLAGTKIDNSPSIFVRGGGDDIILDKGEAGRAGRLSRQGTGMLGLEEGNQLVLGRFVEIGGSEVKGFLAAMGTDDDVARFQELLLRQLR